MLCRYFQDTTDSDPAQYGRRLFGESAKSRGVPAFSVGLRLRNGAGAVPVFFRAFALRADHPQLENLRAQSPHMSGLCPYVSRGGARDSDHTD
jgi:hypothetical protein